MTICDLLKPKTVYSLAHPIYLAQQDPLNLWFGLYFSLWHRGPSIINVEKARWLLKCELTSEGGYWLRKIKDVYGDALELAAIMHFLLTKTYSYGDDPWERLRSTREWIERSNTLSDMLGGWNKAIAGMKELGQWPLGS
jgi:hypothetical protein